MADFSTLIATLQATIKTNYRQEITGQILQDDLLAMVNVINQLKQDTLAGYAFYGAPLADGDSVSVTQNTFFLVAEGEYEINGSTIEVDAAGVSVIVYDSVNDTTNWYTLFAYDTAPTANSRNAITSGAVAAALAPLATKEDVEAVEQEVAQIAGEAGLAEAVIDTDGAGTEQEFTFRKSGGDGGAYYRKIKGKTIVWNQLVGDTGGSASALGVTFTRNADGSLTISGTATGGMALTNLGVISILTGHKYLISLGKAIPGVSFGAYYESTTHLGTGTGNASAICIVDGSQYSETAIGAFVSDGVSVNETVYPQIFDLTQMFGAGNEPSTVAEFEALYPDAYYPYNLGTLISNDAEAVETTGVNQWNEEWEVGTINLETGIPEDHATYFRSKNYIHLPKGSTIYLFSGTNDYIYLFFYDGNKNYIDYTSRTSGELTLADNIEYIKFVDIARNVYNHGICINLSNAAINGQYFPYWKRTLQLGITTRKDTDGNVPFPNGLQSCPVAQDEATKEGGTIRVGTRAYQAGDESDANVITDGTNTNYALATPVPFTWAEPLNLGVKVDENGTERAVAPEGATAPSAPFVADTTYTMSVARMVEKLQNL